MAAFRPHRFGRYIIVDPIAVGGMAEIYRARLAGSKEGPDRIVVIKKVIANLSQNTEFIQMFEEEIKITVGLTHPNIIQIYDYGQVNNQYFMAMEYVEGKNLRQFVKRLADMKSMFSIDMSSHIISQTCIALGYAHAFKDRQTGKSLGIVHRDISPQNIMISYDGAVKLFDFGIAKAKSASEATQAGVIKGKPSYLSPEQINGETLDGRSDIFALGIVLWELLTAKRLFVADTDMGVLRLIQSAKIEAPSTFNPSVPPALDAIVLKSLARDRLKRYQNAEEFQRDLYKFLYSFNQSFNPADLSYYAQELFKGEIKEDRERLHVALSTEPLDDTNNEEIATGDKKSKTKLSTVLADGLVSSNDFNREMMEKVTKEQTGAVDGSGNGASFKSKNNTNIAASRSVLTGTGAPKLPTDQQMVIPPWSKKPGGTSTTTLRPGSGSTSMLRKDLSKSQGRSGSRTAIAFLVVLVAALFGAHQLGLLKGTPLEIIDTKFRELASKEDPIIENVAPPPKPVIATPAPEQAVAPSAAPTAANQGIIILSANVNLEESSVLVNGIPTKLYGDQFPVPLRTPLTVQVSKPGYAPVSFSLAVPDAKPVAYQVNLVQLAMGSLDFNTTPNAKLTFISEGNNLQPMHFQTPMKGQQMPVGDYRVLMENDLIGFRGETTVKIEQGKLTRVERALK